MKSITRKWVITGIEIVFAGVALWKAPLVLEYYLGSDRATPKELDARSHPTAAVRQLLDRTDATAPRMDGEHACIFATVENSKAHTQFGKCATPTIHSGPVDRFEADLRYGYFIVRQSDLYLSDVFDVPLTRSYNSGEYAQPNHVHAYGRNTNHPYDVTILGTSFPYTYMVSVLEDGDFLFFPRVSKGTGFADAIYQHTETSTRFYKAVITWNGYGWTLFREDGSLILFPESYHGTNAAQGAPYAMRNSAGDTLSLIRDTNRNLEEIQTPHKHSIRFKYDSQSRIVRAEDDQGRAVVYTYNENGMLWDVKFSSGLARHYTYDGDLMKFISDQDHRILLTNSYDNRWLIRQNFGNGQVYSYSYTFSSRNNTYADSTTVTLPDGTRTTVEVGDSVPEERKKLLR
jgi:YD repeat-containing protein